MYTETNLQKLPTSAANALIVIALIAVIAALYLGAALFVPIALAILLNVVFRPVVHGLERLRIPTPAGAAIVVFAILAAGIGIGFGLNDPVQNWVEYQAPKQLEKAAGKFDAIRTAFSKLGARPELNGNATGPASQPVAAPATQLTSSEHQVSSDIPDDGRPEVGARREPPRGMGGMDASGLIARVLGTTTRFVGVVVEVLMLLYLLLSVGDMFPKKLAKVLSASHDREVARDVESGTGRIVMRYIVLLTVINALQAVIIAAAMWMLGMPTPLLWGVFTFVLEFVPYLGGAAMMAILTIVALSTFDSVGHAMIAPLVYAVMTTINSSVVAPITYGRQLKLNPLAVLVGVLFWFFLWDVPGAFLAVPIVATIKIIADRMPSMHAISEFLGE